MSGTSKTHATGPIEVNTCEPQRYEEVDDGPNIVEINVTETSVETSKGKESSASGRQSGRTAQRVSSVSNGVTGSVGGRQGSFLLQDAGTLKGNTVSGNCFVIPGFGTGDGGRQRTSADP